MTGALPYRPAIDGLRALAVVPVILFHAGWTPFGGGFVGVDVFFVISGYLITTIVLQDLRTGSFGLLAFYERRARRLLPALFLVLGVSSCFAYAWMIPYNLESFGKSLLTTSVFAHNILLIRQSGYWAPVAEFNPLLHTWSLGIEAQYYLVVPLVMVAAWWSDPRRLWPILFGLAAASLGAASWADLHGRVPGFYLLPTRLWEFMLGSFASGWLHRHRDVGSGSSGPAQILSAAGFLLILLAVLVFDARGAGSGAATLVSTIGAVLVIVFARDGTAVARILSSRVMVATGSMSYSLYLWHVPVLAFARIYSAEPPSSALLAVLLLATVPVAFLSWRFVELPFRSGIVGRRVVVWMSILGTSVFLCFGSFLVWARGVPARLYPDVRGFDERHIAYNERAFAFRKDAFAALDGLKVLVTGNSFARDFVNVTVETFALDRVEIVYRDEVADCIASWTGPSLETLLAGADVIVFANRYVHEGCVEADVAFARRHGKRLFYIGPKHFGWNLNWIARLDGDGRRDRFNPLPPDTVRQESEAVRVIPPANYISLLAAIARGDRVPVTDGDGKLLSQDGTHLTPYGARVIGARAVWGSPYGLLLRRDGGDRGAGGR